MFEDGHARGMGLAGQTILAKLLQVLVDKGVLSREEILGLLHEASQSLAKQNTPAANSAVGAVISIKASHSRGTSPNVVTDLPAWGLDTFARCKSGPYRRTLEIVADPNRTRG